MEKLKRYPIALTIAGSDSGGCAGIQADLKTFSSLGVFGTSAITSITAQNTCGVHAIHHLPPLLVRQQIEAVLDDFVVDVVKTGMLPSIEIIEAVASAIELYALPYIVVDPVMVATSGALLVSSSLAEAFRSCLYSRISLITPNIPEAEVLSGRKICSTNDMRQAADVLLAQGCSAVLIKGGHLQSNNSVDMLFTANKEPLTFSSPVVNSCNLHGTGCTLSSAIAAYMALGHCLEDAVRLAKAYISNAIIHGKDVATGHGAGPVNHFFDPQPLKCKPI